MFPGKQRAPGHDRKHQRRLADIKCERRHRRGRGLRLDSDHHRSGCRGFAFRIEREPAPRQRLDRLAWLRLDHHQLFRIEPARQPAVEHGGAHLAGADQDEGANGFERLRFAGGHDGNHTALGSTNGRGHPRLSVAVAKPRTAIQSAPAWTPKRHRGRLYVEAIAAEVLPRSAAGGRSRHFRRGLTGLTLDEANRVAPLLRQKFIARGESIDRPQDRLHQPHHLAGIRRLCAELGIYDRPHSVRSCGDDGAGARWLRRAAHRAGDRVRLCASRRRPVWTM